MNELISVILIIGIFLGGSYILNFYLRLIKSPLWFVIIAIVYLISIYFYFEIVNKVHQFFRNSRIYIDFGHGSLLLIEMFFICIIVAIANLFWVAIKRRSLLKKIK